MPDDLLPDKGKNPEIDFKMLQIILRILMIFFIFSGSAIFLEVFRDHREFLP